MRIPLPPAIDEDVTNKADGSVNFTKKVTQADGSEKEVPLITLDKEGVYKYIITEKAGTDPKVDYDGMRVTATVTVTEKKDASGNYLVSTNIRLHILNRWPR